MWKFAFDCPTTFGSALWMDVVPISTLQMGGIFDWHDEMVTRLALAHKPWSRSPPGKAVSGTRIFLLTYTTRLVALRSEVLFIQQTLVREHSSDWAAEDSRVSLWSRDRNSYFTTCDRDACWVHCTGWDIMAWWDAMSDLVPKLSVCVNGSS